MADAVLSAPGATRTRRRAPRVGGMVALSTTEYPDGLAAVVFCQGCPWRCTYCHNPHLLDARGERTIAWPDIAAFLGRRRGLLDAVVFSGGEATLQAGLDDALQEIRGMGFRVSLHTAGVYPRRLRALLPLLDHVALDIKAPRRAYRALTGSRTSGERAFASLDAVLASGVDYEVRTTVQPRLLTPAALLELAATLAHLGVRHYALQEFRATGCANVMFEPAASYLTDEFCASIAPLFESFTVRRA